MRSAVVLAAGRGTRLRSSKPKVLHEAAGRPLLGWVLHALAPLELDHIVVVIGHGAEQVRAYAESLPIPGISCVVQEQQNGTGHAVRIAMESGALDAATDVMVLAGDVPGISTETLSRVFVERGGAAAAVVTTRLDDPTGYGRMIRYGSRITGIVEERDASPEQKRIDEINTGLFAFEAQALRDALGQLTTDNAQGEEYLTDTVAYLAQTRTVVGLEVDSDEVEGVNDRSQLATISSTLNARTLDRLMAGGVGIVDPSSTYVDADVVVEPDALLLPGVMLHGATRIASGAEVGPYSRLTDTVVESGATVAFTVSTGAEIGPEAQVGPYTHLRPGTVLHRGAKAGGFVETKKAVIGEGSKVPHLSYVGDADLGKGVNFGAGSVTVNYDGFNKFHTTIGDGAFVGSDTMLVAPIEVGPGAYVGAGSTITTDVPADALAIERAERRTIDGWGARNRERHTKQSSSEPTSPTESGQKDN
ncbi:bifunctional UDP-N-acetylglucosamine diphosphorylase/glucosamine-1-phosphate N-acetyltransferase GlmU [Euzebya tangerina]|uniref:bifunctional UDP-N-acetylglucosamine diphosphorylase/glucosamine-1-phosphate N-acetyltransferase GlmU n=1 Tax=Euzebya tangerina TaxID=591198 RepID=UPI000E323D29|nr:bifunctional UDP-N-acetylglucosamine diphosphorylase/glucosamine-1-phosphate N-acetyltransferase GlmU [Euzebya tangerina]